MSVGSLCLTRASTASVSSENALLCPVKARVNGLSVHILPRSIAHHDAPSPASRDQLAASISNYHAGVTTLTRSTSAGRAATWQADIASLRSSRRGAELCV